MEWVFVVLPFVGIVISSQVGSGSKRVPQDASSGEGDEGDSSPSSFLDGLQKDAQAKELEPGTTSPAFFMLLSLIQPVFAKLVSMLLSLSPTFEVAAMLCLGSHWAGFALARILGTDKLFDITEDVSYFFIFLYTYLQRLDGPPSARQTVVFALGLCWCVRICAFVGYRIMVRGRDWRFDKLSTNQAPWGPGRRQREGQRDRRGGRRDGRMGRRDGGWHRCAARIQSAPPTSPGPVGLCAGCGL